MSSLCIFRKECFSHHCKSLSIFQIRTPEPANPAITGHLKTEGTKSLVVLKEHDIFFFIISIWYVPHAKKKKKKCTQHLKVA